MPSEARKMAVPKFPLRLMPSVRRTAEVFSEKEGVSLNQFINVAVAEKLAHLEHEEWVRNRKQPSKELAARALRLLDKTSLHPVDLDNQLPTTDESISSKRPRLSVTKRRPSVGVQTVQNRRK